MITLCGHCNMDSAGNHEWGCPCSPKTYPGQQVDDVVAALGLRIAALEAQLAAVTAERDAIVFAAHMPSDYAHGLASWINQELYATYLGVKISPHVVAQIESGQLTFPGSPIYTERDTLQAALKACAEALDAIIPCCLIEYTDQLGTAMDALANPVVLKVLSRKGGDADGKEATR